MFSESERIKYDIENETKEIPDARAYLLKLKDIRTRQVSDFDLVSVILFG